MYRVIAYCPLDREEIILCETLDENYARQFAEETRLSKKYNSWYDIIVQKSEEIRKIIWVKVKDA